LAERVRQLLTNGSESGTAAAEKKAKPTQSPSSKRRHWIIGAGLGGAAVVIATAAWLLFAQNRSVQQTSLTGLVTAIPEKSIAVLPFESLSENKSDTYFADGVQDEILNNLAKIAQLKVISRTSVMQYRADNKRDLRQIANALGVANVLEGAVRRDGNHVRVSTELVDARNDNTIWADSYDRDLTDIFAIQSEVAQVIANKLTATLSPEEKKSIEQKPTDNLAAYDLYLRAKESIAKAELSLPSGNFEKPLIDSIALLEQAVQLDSRFAFAYCAATHAHDLLYISYDPSANRRGLADAAIDSALRLQPDLPEAHLTYAYHLYFCYRDYERARVQLAIAKPGLPNNSDAIELPAFIDRRQGHFEKAVQGFKEALALDPRNPDPISDLAYTLYAMREFRAAEEVYDQLINRVPDQPMLKVQKEWFVTFMKTGDNTRVRSAIPELPAATAKDRGGFEQLNQKVRASPGSAPLLSALAIVDALLGRKQDAIEEARRAARR
jgi:TolB-like protein/Tfp pilus assembly protein PilF